MTTHEPERIDRQGWPPGPWDDEPDHVQWRTTAGYPAIAHRNETGFWCGYVAVPRSHRALEGERLEELSVHGGLTYGSDGCRGAICHTPAAGEPDAVYWVGFDCMHGGDSRPGWAFGGTYRDLGFVRSECERLAEQIKALE
jgi:hypothetical protein